jgi:2-polyprenyl-3-methyl-5-hydroxy-6-metoxy-1,4-benzoquinol methylase
MAKSHSHRGRLLDVGCSVGTLLSVAREMDWEVEGLEPNPKAANLARRQGFTIHEGFFTEEQVRKLPGGYQCVVMSDVIEHVSDPREALRLARELLEPGGFLLLSTPNLESFWCKKFQLKPMEHLFLFSPKSLRRLLESLGLKIYHLQRTSRRRDLRELNHSTTELGKGVKIMIAGLRRLGIDGVAAWLMDYLFRDELLVIARRSRRAEP